VLGQLVFKGIFSFREKTPWINGQKIRLMIPLAKVEYHNVALYFNYNAGILSDKSPGE